jgi:hypothetical protein
MTDENRPGEPTTPDRAKGVDADATGPGGAQKSVPADADDQDELVDKTDMSAVGDDGQVFGG